MRSISPTASLKRSMALRVPLHPNALRRRLALKAHAWEVATVDPDLPLPWDMCRGTVPDGRHGGANLSVFHGNSG